MCSETRNMLNNTCKIIETQLLELKTAKTRMEFDLTDKTDAYEIDKNCVELSNNSPIILKHPGATRVPTEYVIINIKKRKNFYNINLNYFSKTINTRWI